MAHFIGLPYMNTPSTFDDAFLLEIGRIAVAKGSLKLALLAAGDSLFATRPGDKGMVQVMMGTHQLPELCYALLTMARTRATSPDGISKLQEIASEHRDDFVFAAAVVDGSWKPLGSAGPADYGLWQGTVLRNGNLEPQWRGLILGDLQKLRERLEYASQAVLEVSEQFKLDAIANRLARKAPLPAPRHSIQLN
jgi:hypothetical protein